MTANRRHVLRSIAAAGTVGVVGALAGCGGGGGGDGGDGGGDGGSPTVDMTDDLIYEPESITVSTGDTVVWDNVGSLGHSVTAYEDQIPGDADYFASGGFGSEQAARDGYPQQGDIPGGETWEYTFTVPGTYEYFCIPHETAGMVGTVEVE